MKITKAELLAYLQERCPDEVDVHIVQTSSFREDLKIYNLVVPRPQIDLEMLSYIKAMKLTVLTDIKKRFKVSESKVVSILEELEFLPCYDLKCYDLKPDMGDIGCDTIIGVFHDSSVILDWLVELNKYEKKYCTDLEFKAEQIQEYKWFLECPKCYALRLIDLEHLPPPKQWSKNLRQEVNVYFNKEIKEGFNKKGKG